MYAISYIEKHTNNDKCSASEGLVRPSDRKRHIAKVKNLQR